MHRRVAIIAYSFRFPGTDIQNFWADLLAKKDLVTEVEPSRWSQQSFLHPDKRHPGSSYTFAAGSIGDISGFDAAFFGISPREAALMDPQQRLLLELAWETFENAGIVPSALRGSDCGVFIGISNVDYAYRLADDFAAIDSSAATGTISSIAANRISYVFDLHGPSIAMDTACSSSLVAFHQACQSIRTGETTQALAGGINLHLHPFGFISFSKATMLSKTGRCHVFDESGDGYVRSEGGGLFLLKDYEQAVIDGDPILAIVAGSGVNTDGHKSGLTIPNPKAQADLMVRVYQQAGIDPNNIDYFEAHGTGTAVGDPIETQAIGFALGQKRKKPLLIGSIKSNLGHLESASGVAGLAKALNCIEHRAIPATIGIKNVNPTIKLNDWNIQIVTETQSLKAKGDLIVGINSFGFGGANAHVVLKSQPLRVKNKLKKGSDGLVFLQLSAKDTAGLNQAALELADFLENPPELSLYDVAYSALFHREHHPQCALVFVDTSEEAINQLRQFADTEATQAHAVYTGLHLHQAKGPAFVYSGNGCQWVEMGKCLLEQSATFRRVVTEIDQLFSHYGDFSLVDELAGLNGSDRYEATEIAQPALFALQVGVTEVLREQGVHPCAVTGHSVGEVAAAWACGALSLADAVQVIFYRSHHQGKTKGSGQMTAVGLSASEVSTLLEQPRFDALYLAGINSYRGVTLAGSSTQLTLLEAELATRTVFFKRLNLDYAFHSPAMDVMEAELRLDLAQLHTQQAIIPFFSTVSGTLYNAPLDGEYWWHNIRHPVQFQLAVDSLLDTGINVFVEIGAHPVLQAYLRDSLKASDTQGLIIPTLIRNKDTLSQLMNSVAQTFISGADFDRKHWFPRVGEFIRLPNYPWQREKCWHPLTTESHGLLTRKMIHPLLGYPLAQHELLWENQLDTQLQPFLADHKVGGVAVFPGAGFIEVALAAAYQTHPADTLEIEELEIRAPLLLNQDHSKVIRFSLAAADNRFSLSSREFASSADWSPHLVGRVLGEATGRMLDMTAPLILPERTPDFDSASHAELTESVGLGYGPAFQAIHQGWSDSTSAIGRVTIPASIRADLDQYFLHPALLDCAFQLVFQILKEEIANHHDLAFVPIKIGKIHLRTHKVLPYAFKATLLHRSPHSLNAEFVLYDVNGNALALLKDVRFRAVRLQRPHTQHLHYLNYHLTAAPRGIDGLHNSQVLTPTVTNAIGHALALHECASRRYSEEVEPLLDSLCNQFIVEALSSLADAEGVLHDSKIPAESTALRAVIQLAVDNQLLRVVEDDWQLDAAVLSPEFAAAAIWNTLVQEYPDYFYLIHLAGRAGIRLNQLLSGAIHPDSIGLTPSLYATINSYLLEQTGKQVLSNIFVEHCQKIIADQPAGERLSILEISAHKPEFADLLCAQLDLNQSDYCFASFCDDALNTAEALRENFPLLQTQRLNPTADNSDQPTATRASFAIVHLNMANPQETHRLLAQLPSLLLSGSPVFFIGQHPVSWIDMVLGSTEGWWLTTENHALLSPQLSAHHVAEHLKTLNYANTQRVECVPESDSGLYLLSTHTVKTQLNPAERATQNWLIVAGNCEPELTLSAQLSQHLSTQGQNVRRQDSSEPLPALDSVDHILHLAGLGQADTAEQAARCGLVSELVQACEATSATATLWLLTQGVGSLFPCDQKNAPVTHRALANDAALWGFGRSLMNEASHYRVHLLDIDTDSRLVPDTLCTAIINELLADDNEQEVLLNAAGQRFVPRLRVTDTATTGDNSQQKTDDSTLQLGFKLPGQLRNLQWQAIPRLAPAIDEVEVDIKATGLNFRDIMYTLGLLPDEAVENGFVGATLGLEFAGVVTRVGAAVTTFKSGDHVVGLGPASFSNRVLTKANALAAIPETIGMAAAATIPSTFFTVYYALHHQARLQPGEKILIHGAAGGVGLAAIQVAHWLGAEIYATVGSDDKRDVLTLLGIEHIYDSRSLKFAEDILLDTQQQGVDVVLNSLAGEAINRNFQVLKPFGRFLELGKRDFYENTHIGLRPFRNNISYFGIDADQLMKECPELTRRLFTDMMQLFHDGILHPLPYTTFDANQVIDAFRYMQQAKQIGKIVVTYNTGIYVKPSVKPAVQPTLKLSAQVSYLVTGGLGGFGLRTAQWLVEKGARYLILISRSGATSAEAIAALAQFAEQGVTVYACACDVTDRAALVTLLADCDTTLPPLKGIVHSATVIDDGLARNLSRAQIQRVLEPKILGAKYLHELTLNKSLDLFVLYSSVTTLFGNPGQSNYVAANLWLEALAAHRQQQGLAVTCVRWGAIDDVGFLARNEKIKEALQSRMGGAALTSTMALAVLENLILAKAPTLGVMEFDWHSLSHFLPTAQAPKFRELARTGSTTDNTDDQRADIKRLLTELSDEALKAAFIELLKEELSQILLIAKDKINPDCSMYDMGLDSLMGVELMIAIESRFTVQIPVMALSEAPTLNKLAERLMTQLRSETPPSETTDTLATINDLSKRHASEVSEAQISALSKELESSDSGRLIIH